MKDEERFKSEVKKDVNRIQKAQEEETTLLAQTIYLGTIGVMMVLPIIVGAYLGSYLDQKLSFFSTSWTVSLILIGVFVGGLNVYFFIKENE